MTHNELAARIERAEGPDRALDELIHEASGLPFVMEYYTEYATEQTRNMSYVPRYTASIDAAMQLVPGGWQLIKIEWFTNDTWHVVMRDWHIQSDIYPAKVSNGQSKNPALALCAAALRARSAS